MFGDQAQQPVRTGKVGVDFQYGTLGSFGFANIRSGPCRRLPAFADDTEVGNIQTEPAFEMLAKLGWVVLFEIVLQPRVRFIRKEVPDARMMIGP